MHSQESEEIFLQYRQTKNNTRLPLKLRMYFSTFEQLIYTQHLPSDLNKHHVVDQSLMRAFQNKSEAEKVSFLLKMIRSIKEYLDSNRPSSLDTEGLINNIETTCQLETVSFGMSRWSLCRFKFDIFQRMASVTNKKRTITIHLEHYLARKSKKNKNTLVFEAVSKEISKQNERVSLFFEDSIFSEIQKLVMDCIFQIQKERAVRLLSGGEEIAGEKGENSDKFLVFLSSSQLTLFLKYKAMILERINISNLNFRSIYQKKGEGVLLQRSSRIDKIFRLQFQSNLSPPQFKSVFLTTLQSKYRYRFDSSILQEFSKKYCAVYDRYLLNSKIYEQLSIRESSVSDKEDIFFLKGVDNMLTTNHLQFIAVKVYAWQNGSKAIVTASILLENNINVDIATAFMLQFRNMLERGQEEQQKLQQTQQEEFFSIIQESGEIDQVMLNFEAADQIKSTMEIQEPETYLNCPNKQIRLKPYEMTEEDLKSKRMKQHFLLKEWQRCKNGGVVCINEEMLIQQKKMIKKIATSIGSNVFKIARQGGIINISLPVTIFKKQSHLQSIARNFSYAPLFFDSFQNSNDTLERFKQCVLFAISICNLGISSQKPFNPILGETLQCWIGGCPIYMEQISHHPPISAYYMQGRGYTISGLIDPKISLSSINGGKCWSDKPNYINFDDGSSVCINFAKMAIRGLIFGDRQFNFQDRTFIYDMKNHYFADLWFGPVKKGFMSYSKEPEDYIHGKIYRTTSAYLSKFKQHFPPTFPDKDDIAKELCSIDGIWSQQIKFDNQQYINFSKLLPYEMENEPQPLPSNSLFRKDLSYYIEGDMNQAQQNKELMEQIQRRDKKLRDQFKK